MNNFSLALTASGRKAGIKLLNYLKCVTATNFSVVWYSIQR